MSIAEDLQQVEISIESAKAAISKRDAIYRLYKNKDFKQVITQGLFVEDAARWVTLKAVPTQYSDENQAGILRSIDSIGTLQLYLETKVQIANQMERALEADEQTRDELMAEDV